MRPICIRFLLLGSSKLLNKAVSKCRYNPANEPQRSYGETVCFQSSSGRTKIGKQAWLMCFLGATSKEPAKYSDSRSTTSAQRILQVVYNHYHAADNRVRTCIYNKTLHSGLHPFSDSRSSLQMRCNNIISRKHDWHYIIKVLRDQRVSEAWL